MNEVKICGLRRTEDIVMANELKPDYVGFVFAPSSRRVTKEQAAGFRKLLDSDITSIGVFVNEKTEVVADIAAAGIIDMIQLHGEEDRAYITQLRKETQIPLIKAVRVQNKEQILEAEKLPCEYLLLDTYIEGQHGGSGQTFDLGLIPDLRKPFFLAGGLTVENVAGFLGRCGAFAADVSSAVETDGYKDRRKAEAFIRAVRG